MRARVCVTTLALAVRAPRVQHDTPPTSRRSHLVLSEVKRLLDRGLTSADLDPHRLVLAHRVGSTGTLHAGSDCSKLNAAQRALVARVEIDVMTSSARTCQHCFDLSRTGTFFREAFALADLDEKVLWLSEPTELNVLRRLMAAMAGTSEHVASLRTAALARGHAKRVELVAALGPDALEDAFTEVLLRGRVANDFLIPLVAGIPAPSSHCGDHDDPRLYVADAWRVAVMGPVQPGSSSWWTSPPAEVEPLEAVVSVYEDYVKTLVPADLPADLEIDPELLKTSGTKAALADAFRGWCGDRAQDTCDALEELLTTMVTDRGALVLVRGQHPEACTVSEAVLASGVTAVPDEQSQLGWTLLQAPESVAELLGRQGFATTSHRGELDLTKVLETFLSLHTAARRRDVTAASADLARAAALEA